MAQYSILTEKTPFTHQYFAGNLLYWYWQTQKTRKNQIVSLSAINTKTKIETPCR